ncbi:MAG: dephospho-CoA kinase [Gemmatimonadetes bacterium]|nr:dephospho-CoA kinase [Gemmatimonadota bacterium]
MSSQRRVPVIGLTGSIASGKSTVSAQLRELGAAIVDADQLARDAVAPGTAALAAIADRWGPAMIAPDGTLDRAALRRVVFADTRERRALEAIVHPDVEALRHAAIARARETNVPVIVCDIPLLFEKHLEHEFEGVVFVEARDDVRRERLIAMRGLTAADAEAMMAAQLPSDGKRRRATWVIENNGTLDALRQAVAALWPTLLALGDR